MRARSFLLSFLVLFASTVAAVGATAQQGGPPDGPPGQGGGGPPSSGNETGDNTTAEPSHPGGGASAVARDRAAMQRQETGADPGPAWGRAMQEARTDPESLERLAELEQLPAPARERFGMLLVSDDGFDGRYVSFEADPEWGALRNVSAGGTLLFESVFFPPEENVSARHRGNILELSGDTWRFHIVDAPSAPVHVRSTAFPTQFVLAPGASTEGSAGRLNVSFPRDDGALGGRFVGGATPDPAAPLLVQVLGEATFQVQAQHVAMAGIASEARPALEAAKERRALGGEVTLLARATSTPADGVVSEVVPYEDVDIEFASGTGIGEVPANASVHTITVSAHGIPGKTFVVNVDGEAMDLNRLSLRYYNIVDGEALAVPLVAASSLEEALDPTGSGLVPRYWVIPAEDGFQLVFAVPHFSTHVLELLSFDREIVVKIVLTAGILGAVAIVALAVVGLFRRPEDAL